MDVFEEITIGALLHDIGKVRQRAETKPAIKRHQEWGAEWLDANGLSDFREFSLYHHRLSQDDPKRDMLSIDRSSQSYRGDLWIVFEADNLSSAERMEERREEWDQQIPLVSILSTLRLRSDAGDSGRSKIFAFPTVLGTEYPFPQQYSRGLETSPVASPDSYRKILAEIEAAIHLLTSKGMLTCDSLLPLLEGTLSFVPSETGYDPSDPSKNPDVSLFDHL